MPVTSKTEAQTGRRIAARGWPGVDGNAGKELGSCGGYLRRGLVEPKGYPGWRL